MKRKKGWFFTIFTIVVMIGVAISLVLIPKDDEQNSDNNNTDDKTPQQTYATAFSVNLPNTINMSVGASINFLTGFITVSPTSMLEKLTFELSSSDIKFENNKLTANNVGNYTLNFKMPKSESTYFSKTISIKVYENNPNNHITQVCFEMLHEESLNINEIFSINDGLNYTFKTDNNLSFANNIITAKNIAESKITCSVVEEYVEYVYDFNILIKELPEYTIVLNNVSNNTILLDTVENDVFHINYQVFDQNNEHVTQNLLVVSTNEQVVIIEKIYDDSLIKIRGIGVGNATIRISVKSNPSIYVEVDVYVQ